MVTIDFNSRKKNTMEVNGYHRLSGYQHFLFSVEERNSYILIFG